MVACQCGSGRSRLRGTCRQSVDGRVTVERYGGWPDAVGLSGSCRRLLAHYSTAAGPRRAHAADPAALVAVVSRPRPHGQSIWTTPQKVTRCLPPCPGAVTRPVDQLMMAAPPYLLTRPSARSACERDHCDRSLGPRLLETRITIPLTLFHIHRVLRRACPQTLAPADSGTRNHSLPCSRILLPHPPPPHTKHTARPSTACRHCCRRYTF